MSNRDNGRYQEEQGLIRALSGLMPGLDAMVQQSTLRPMQQGRPFPGGTIDGKALANCCINPTHCYRTVSQRSLNVPVRFTGFQNGVPNITAGDDIFATLFSEIGGALHLVANTEESFFNNNDVQIERARVNQLVLIAVRSSINVQLMDGEPIAAGAIDVSNFQSHMEKLANALISLKVYHTSDRKDPWIDTTSLSYFDNPHGQYQLIPPVMWVDRDPVMSLQISQPEFSGGAPNTSDYVGMSNALRDLEGVADITIESLFIPDPYTCPDLWPGQLCPRDMIGNTPDYKGKIASAVRRLTGGR